MSDSLDPLHAADRIAGDYVRYLRSAFSPSDPDLRKDFNQQLSEGKQLTKGPILQAQAPYTHGATPRELIEDGILHPELGRLAETDFDLDRPLYIHQEEAIRKASAGRNLIVATGTGSGKTESFLLPILDNLVREIKAGTAAAPGVRALLLYPMNALANDQMLRLRTLLSPYPELTFGRYVGDTEHTYEKGLDQYRMRFGTKPTPNELICRDDMKARPPHVLVTNFAMLEYLLLRPEDQTFFDGPTGEHWRFIVLDEVHVYDGAKGAEIGMLLRRVRDRVLRSEKGTLTCIGTSATLGDGPEDLPRLANFGRQLFDELFEWFTDDPARQDIVEATRNELIGAGVSWFLPEDRIVALRDAFRSGESVIQLGALTGDAGAPSPDFGETAAQWLGRALSQETHVVALQHLLVKGSVDLTVAAREVMSGSNRDAELTALVDLCVGAESDDGRALVPARWHFLLRALEGAFTCIHPDHPPAEPRLRLSRFRRCPGCESQRRESAMFEAAVCRRCGARYIVGEELPGDDGAAVLAPPRPFAEQPRTFLVVGGVTSSVDAEDDEDEVAAEEGPADRFDPAVVCPQCGSLGLRKLSCGCGVAPVALLEVKPTAPDRPVRHCASCGGRTSAGSIVQRFLTGADAPVAVIATSLYQELPAVGRVKNAVGDGRKLLSFADSRQDAAFFAPYLERTYNRAVQRRLLWQVLSDAQASGDNVLRIPDLLTELKNRAIDTGLIDEFDEETPPAMQARHWLYGEIVGSDRRQSLEGVGLAEIAIPVPRHIEAPEQITSLGLSATEALDLIRILLNSVRRSRAITVSTNVNLEDPIFEGRPMTGLRGDQSATRVLSWNPSRGTNQRVKYVAKVLEELGRSPGEAKQLVHDIWEHWLVGDDWAEVLVREEAAFEKGVVYRLQTERLEFRPGSRTHQPLRCERCRQVWWRAILGLCPGIDCDGTVEPFDPETERSHYRELYTSLSPIGLRVEEHTAQLSNAIAAKRQQEFIEGKINALSCSTTFELGVDVGAIQAVLMRNVPPSPANYVQRAGRAGRRAGSPALVVTFAQRRSHDLQFFDRPQAMIDGRVAAPVVNIENPAIVRRHLNAMAFAEFEKAHYDGSTRPHSTVQEFFTPGGTSPSDEMMAWLRTEPAEIGDAVERVVPDGLVDHPDIDVRHWGWLDGLDGDPKIEGRGRLEIAGREIRRELGQLDREIEDAYEDRRAGRAKHLEYVRKSISKARTLDRLARVGVLPKYGFPVDVVALDLGTETSVAIDRDLTQAVADFAPGNFIVADKRLWEPIGLKVEAGLPLLVHRVAVCSNHSCGARWTWLDELENPPPCPSCDTPGGTGSRLIQPRFGFIGRDTGRRPGDQRPAKVAFATSFFDDYEGPRPAWNASPVGTRSVRIATSRQGRITVVNQGPGRGYEICRWCGFIREASSVPLANHDRPTTWGDPKKQTKCDGFLTRTYLGHWYLTDSLQIDPGLPFGAAQMSSVVAALLAGTEAVGIAHSDVSGSVSPLGAGHGTIVLYDAVPGGAGHAHRLGEVLPDLFRAARALVANCDCGIDTSCYGCLRSYRNQREHGHLQRQLALQVFDAIGVR